MTEKAKLSREIPLLGFPVQRPLPIVPAELLQLQLFGRGLLVLRGGVVAPFALGALERDDLSGCCHWSDSVRKKLRISNEELRIAVAAGAASILNSKFLILHSVSGALDEI